MTLLLVGDAQHGNSQVDKSLHGQVAEQEVKANKGNKALRAMQEYAGPQAAQALILDPAPIPSSGLPSGLQSRLGLHAQHAACYLDLAGVRLHAGMCCLTCKPDACSPQHACLPDSSSVFLTCPGFLYTLPAPYIPSKITANHVDQPANTQAGCVQATHAA